MYLDEEDRVVGFEDAGDSGIEIVEVELFRDELVEFRDGFEVDSNYFKCFYDVVDFIEMGFLEEEFNEDVEEFLVGH